MNFENRGFVIRKVFELISSDKFLAVVAQANTEANHECRRVLKLVLEYNPDFFQQHRFLKDLFEGVLIPCYECIT